MIDNKIEWSFIGELPESALFGCEDFWYELTMGGRINPNAILTDNDQIKRLNDAIAVIESFEHALSVLIEDAEEE